MICKTCHISLSKPIPTMSKHALSIHRNIVKNCKCIICWKEVDEKKITQEYNKNTPQLKSLLQNNTVEEVNGKIVKLVMLNLNVIHLLNVKYVKKNSKGTIQLLQKIMV